MTQASQIGHPHYFDDAIVAFRDASKRCVASTIALALASVRYCHRPEQRRVIAVFTDGVPNSAPECAEEVAACHRAGIAILAGMMEDCDRLSLITSTPGVELFEIGNRLEAGFLRAIQRIARR